MRRSLAFALLPLALALGGAAPEGAGAGGGGTLLRDAKPEAALLDKGDLGIVIYALLFVIALLLVFSLFDRLAARGVAKETAAGMGRIADALSALNIQISRLESRFGRRDDGAS